MLRNLLAVFETIFFHKLVVIKILLGPPGLRVVVMKKIFFLNPHKHLL